ncbi:MAG TPA: ABC transporter permease [Dehalococcoidia bacterium]|nr:ABC transporter permease [Dehalococcoidia bacterium]
MSSRLARNASIRLEAVEDVPVGHGYWAGAWRRLLRNRVAVAGLLIIAILVTLAIAAPLVAPHDPSTQNLRDTFASPSLHHLAGTDNLGRDWLSRLIYGARVSLTVGIFAQVIVLGIGLPVGLIAGYRGGFADSLLMRTADLFYAFPDLLLIILLRAVVGGSVFMLFLIIGLVTWMDTARLVRGQVLTLREREFVTAARSLGASDREIMTRHLLPNLAGPVIVLVALGVPRAVFAEAALSFIGFGVTGSTPSWGTMVEEGYSAIVSFPYLVIFPSIAIALLMLSFTFLGDGLRDALDPSTDVSPSLPKVETPRRRKAPPAEPTELPKAA